MEPGDIALSHGHVPRMVTWGYQSVTFPTATVCPRCVVGECSYIVVDGCV